MTARSKPRCRRGRPPGRRASCSGWGPTQRSWSRPSSARRPGRSRKLRSPGTPAERPPRHPRSVRPGPLKGGLTRADASGEMTTIRTTCPRCGEVDMGPEAISLAVRSNGREGSYRFTCPSCEDDVEKRADRKIVALLVSAGVDISRSEADIGLAPELFDEEEDLEPREPAAPRF